MKRALSLGIFLLVPFSIATEASAAAPADGTTPVVEKPADPKRWGDASFNVVERFGQLVLPNPEVGKSGLVKGMGLEVRFVIPVAEWGAYYRYVTTAQHGVSEFDWSHSEFMMGFSRRLLHVGNSALWSPRASAHLDLGVGYTTVATHESCPSNITPWGSGCSTGSRSALNATSDALAAEARVGGDLSFGVLFLGVDVGASILARITTGGSSVSAPGLMYLPSGQVRLGVGFPFS
jgi:hypothetical protein